KLRNVENRYKNEIENLTGCYEQITVKNDTLEKRLTEGFVEKGSSENFESFTADGSQCVESLERKLQDAQAELKAIDDSNKQIPSSSTRKSSLNRIDDDDEEFSDTDSNLVAKWIAEYGLPDALDLNYDITRKYTPLWYDEELQELINAACSILGAWGESTISSTLLHLRSLDWDKKAPIAKYARVTIYHPNASYEVYANHFHDYYKQKYSTSHVFANFWQKVWITTEQDITLHFGNPSTYVLRDVIQFSNSLHIALTMLIDTKRTCSVHLGLGEFHRNTSK
ncbi:unnamed protein product, partial [Rotaria sp. Silwood1]